MEIIKHKKRAKDILNLMSDIINHFLRNNELNGYKLKKENKPSVVNLNIIDSCNSKCTMCNIWKRDEELEISPSQLKNVLSDPLFDNIKHVGVTGGEPTLRDDLPMVYKSIIEAIPSIKGLSIITNAINETDVKKSILDVKKVCDSYNKPFSAMISIDGVGKIHDNVRGIKGNFESAITVFNYLKNELKIPVAFGCTISKINAWEADDLLYYAKKNNMYGRFRIAENINRLYNHDRHKVIRNFDEDEQYNLVLFFEKLKHNYEKNGTYKRTYSSIQNILLGGNRLIGCPYHNDGVVLGSKGQLSYCAPKSKEIGNTLDSSALQLYKNGYKERERILNEDCNTCIHDYHAPITRAENLIKYKNILFNRLLKINNADKVVQLSGLIKKIPRLKEKSRIFILGWYGTETVGDKAILGGIIDFYSNKFGNNVEFVIGSMNPFISERTCKELQINAKVVSTKNIDLVRYAKSSDVIVMGGGPLMDLNELYVPLIGFKIAKKYKNKTVVFGCGLGPLKKQKFIDSVEEILRLSDEIKLRDEGSISFARTLGVKKEIEFFGDPAKKYIENLASNLTVEKKNVVCCFLRDWTFEYFKGSKEEFHQVKGEFEQSLANYIKSEADKLEVNKIEFQHMHNFVVGHDDRDFSRYFVEKYFENDERVFINKKLSTVETIVEDMLKSKLNICMRFHSVLFAQTLQTDFVGIDYTMGGKIEGFLRDNNSLQNRISIDNLISY